MKLYIILTLVLWSTLTEESSLEHSDNEPNPTVSQLLAKNGFKLLTYEITTDDGYILTMFRIVPIEEFAGINSTSKAGSYLTTRKPVILGHCLYCSSDIFFANEDQKNPGSFHNCSDNFGLCLARTGRYDIWLANFRGNAYSQRHVHLNASTDREYWSFSFQQKAQYDLPAVIDFVRNATLRQSVGYLGFSQGTFMMFALLADKPEYAAKIKPYIAWAPGLFMGHMEAPFLEMAPLVKLVKVEGGQFVLTTSVVTRYAAELCSVKMLANDVCALAVHIMAGQTDHLNVSRIPFILRHYFPSPGSSLEVVHIFQIVKRGRLMKYDYGSQEANILHYGSATPPDYPIEQISPNLTTLLVSGPTDVLMTPADVLKSVEFLKGLGMERLEHHQVEADEWNHMDFVTGKGSGGLVNDPTVRFFDRYCE